MTEGLTFQLVAKLSAVEPDYPLRVRVGKHDIALFAADGTVFATDNICTHAYASLADGFVEEGKVECPLHGACFDFRTGRALTAPAEVDLRTHPVRIEGDDVLVGLPDD